MSKIKLTYNPFTVKSDLEVDGDIQGVGSDFYNASVNKRLPQWIDQLFTVQLFDALNTKKIDFVFEGIDSDAEDVKSAVETFQVQHPNLTLSPEYILYESKAEDRVEKIKQLFEEAQTGPFDAFRSPEMHKSFDKAMSSEFDVTVLATMSAGKSTVINSMVGWEVLPSKNEACTATIARIINDDAMDIFEARRLSKLSEDSNEVYVSDDWQTIALENSEQLISKWNDDPLTSTIEVRGNIPDIRVRQGIQMVFVDTPGPNNSNDPSHSKATAKAISSAQPSMVLYILNATQLGVEDDLTLLNMIKEEMAKGGREAQDRFIFVANKIDTFDTEKESVPSLIKNVKDYLKNNGIENPLVIPVSAELTKLIRMDVNNAVLTKKQKSTLRNLSEDFSELDELNILEHVRFDLDVITSKKLQTKLDQLRADGNDDKVAELLSGIPIIEALLDNYLTKHAIPARIKDTVDIFHRVEEQNAVIDSTQAILEKSAEEISEINLEIKKLQDDEILIEKAKSFRTKLESKNYVISKETKSLQRDIERKINEFLDDIQRDFMSDLRPSEAKLVISKAERHIKALTGDIEALLEEDLQANQLKEIEALRQEYEHYVEDLLESLPDTEIMRSIRSLQKASLKMKDAKALLDENTFEEQTRVFKGTERHGFLWLKKRDIYETTYEDKVDMNEVLNEYQIGITNFKRESLNNYTSGAKSMFEDAKEAIINQMNEIDNKFSELVASLQVAEKNIGDREKALEENRKHLDWYEGFRSELNSVLSLKIV